MKYRDIFKINFKLIFIFKQLCDTSIYIVQYQLNIAQKVSCSDKLKITCKNHQVCHNGFFQFEIIKELTKYFNFEHEKEDLRNIVQKIGGSNEKKT